MKPLFYLLYSLLSLSMVTGAFAAEVLQGIGIAEDEKKARSYALEDLASSLLVEVNSQITICQEVKTNTAEDCGSKSTIRTSTRLPLLGVKYAHKKINNNEYQVEATLDPATALTRYSSELSRLHNSINSSIARLDRMQDQQAKVNTYNHLHSTIEQYEKLRLVASLLGDSYYKSAAISAAEVESRLLKIQQRAEIMQYLGRILAEKITEPKVYIFPPSLRTAKEITPFARAVRDQIRKHKPMAVNDFSQANYLLRGQYEILQDGDIHLVYNLLDSEYNNRASFTLRVKKSAYEGYRANALAADFDQLLHQNLAISNQFKSEIVTDKGSQDLFFNSGNEVRLLVRLNQPGYFYVVGHVRQKDAEFSYLIELSDTKGPGKFIKYMPADYANRYLELGQFSVEAPFGVEHLQVIASDHNLDDRLPAYDYDDKTGYYVINGSRQNSKSAVLKTRGLKLKKSLHQQQPLFHESVLTFTTTP